MNGNPSREQKLFHATLREVGCCLTGFRPVQIHHIFGSKWPAKGFEKPGEWLVMPLESGVHRIIKQYTFEEERQMYMDSLSNYRLFTGEDAPVPKELIDYYLGMKHHYDITHGNPINGAL